MSDVTNSKSTGADWFMVVGVSLVLLGNVVWIFMFAAQPLFMWLGHPYGMPKVWMAWGLVTSLFAIFGAGVVLLKGDILPVSWTRSITSRQAVRAFMVLMIVIGVFAVGGLVVTFTTTPPAL